MRPNLKALKRDLERKGNETSLQRASDNGTAYGCLGDDPFGVEQYETRCSK